MTTIYLAILILGGAVLIRKLVADTCYLREHRWKGCVCNRCQKQRDRCHDFNSCGVCRVCKVEKTSGNTHDWVTTVEPSENLFQSGYDFSFGKGSAGGVPVQMEVTRCSKCHQCRY